MARIGIQLMMLKDHIAERGVTDVLAQVKDTGFTVVEVSQIPMTDENVAAMAAAREDLGIEYAAISARTSGPAGGGYTLADDLEAHVAHARALGTSYMRIGMMPLDALRSAEALDAFCTEANGYAKRLADEGISLSYHNHHVEFARIDGRQILDIIREKAPDLRFEIDCHWVARGGMDPERTLAAFDGVLDLVHLKDFRIALPGPELFEKLDAGDAGSFFGEYWAKDIVQFAEVGQGNLDWKPVIDQGIASGAQHLLIEQDQTYGRDIFEALAMSRAHLVQLGYEELITG